MAIEILWIKTEIFQEKSDHSHLQMDIVPIHQYDYSSPKSGKMILSNASNGLPIGHWLLPGANHSFVAEPENGDTLSQPIEWWFTRWPHHWKDKLDTSNSRPSTTTLFSWLDKVSDCEWNQAQETTDHLLMRTVLCLLLVFLCRQTTALILFLKHCHARPWLGGIIMSGMNSASQLMTLFLPPKVMQYSSKVS